MFCDRCGRGVSWFWQRTKLRLPDGRSGTFCKTCAPIVEHAGTTDAPVAPVEGALGIRNPKAVFDDEVWRRHVIPEQQDAALTELFALVHEVLGKDLAQKSLKDYGFHRRKDRIDLTIEIPFSRAVCAASLILGVESPSWYRSRRDAGAEVLLTWPRCLSIGKETLASADPRRLAFHVGRALAHQHRWLRMGALYVPRELDVFLKAATGFSTPDAEIPLRADLDPEVVAVLLQLISHTATRLARCASSAQREQLAQWVAESRRSDPNPDLGDWQGNTERAANRAGFILAGDLELVCDLIREESSDSWRLSPTSLLEDVRSYAESEAYRGVCAHLGIDPPAG